MVGNAYQISKKIITQNKQLLDKLATKLIEQETVNAEEFKELINKYGIYQHSYQLFDNNIKYQLPFQNISAF